MKKAVGNLTCCFSSFILNFNHFLKQFFACWSDGIMPTDPCIKQSGKIAWFHHQSVNVTLSNISFSININLCSRVNLLQARFSVNQFPIRYFLNLLVATTKNGSKQRKFTLFVAELTGCRYIFVSSFFAEKFLENECASSNVPYRPNY